MYSHRLYELKNTYGQTSNYYLLGCSRKHSLQPRYKTTTQHTKKTKLGRHCTHDNYLKLEIDPVLDGFLRKRHLINSVSRSKLTENNLQTPSKLAIYGKTSGTKIYKCYAKTIATNCETNTKATPRKNYQKSTINYRTPLHN